MINALMFSKDRAMQLDAALRSLHLHCRDAHLLAITVLYAVSNEAHTRHYGQLAQEYPSISFVKETDFKRDVLSLVAPGRFLLFLVDDNIFVRGFSLEDAVSQLQSTPEALAFSLRLGKNTTYCYMLAKYQKLPEFMNVGKGVLGFNWTMGERDFGYPFDVCSSIYRTSEMFPLLERFSFSNPNTLEASLDNNKHDKTNQNILLCFDQSVTFTNPINKVQCVFPHNRGGKRQRNAPSNLAEMFEQGYRIDVSAYIDFVPNGVHQEVGIQFVCTDTGAPMQAIAWWRRWLALLWPVGRDKT